MTEEEHGAAEWLRGIIGEYEANGERSCSAMARMFGIDCDCETSRGCMTKMMTAILARLADLIDRPTCFDTESKDSKSFTCSACGFSESKLVVSPFTLSFLWFKPSYRFCPNCGSEVVS